MIHSKGHNENLFRRWLQRFSDTSHLLKNSNGVQSVLIGRSTKPVFNNILFSQESEAL